MISKTEHKIIFFLIFLLCCVYYIEIAQNWISQYNESVRLQQYELSQSTGNEEKISFGLSCSGRTAFYEFLLFLNFFFIPYLFFINLKRSRTRFFFSLGLTLSIFLGYLFWFLGTFAAIRVVEDINSLELNFKDYFLFGSNYFDIIIFLLLIVLNILQIFLFSRFVIDKFHNKISLK